MGWTSFWAFFSQTHPVTLIYVEARGRGRSEEKAYKFKAGERQGRREREPGQKMPPKYCQKIWAKNWAKKIVQNIWQKIGAKKLGKTLGKILG
jgi:argonaute-like protein implicated in RNA metabolism and viral defense